MEKMIASFAIFTFLLFAVSTATIALDPVVLRDSDFVLSSEFVAAADSDVVIPAEKPKSASEETTANDKLPESEKTQTFDVRHIEPSLPAIFSRSHPIHRHSFDRSTRIPLRFVRRHPCRKFKRMSYGNDMILSDKTTSVDLETIGDQVPAKWLEFKHKYGHRHHHYHHDRNEKFETKYEFDKEKLNSMSRHHKEKKGEQKGGFLRRVRKFLKHTFD